LLASYKTTLAQAAARVDQFGLGRSGWVQCQITPSALVVCSLSLVADNLKSETSTSAAPFGSSPMSLSKVLVWALQMEISLVDWVPRVLRGACRLADYSRELAIKSICLWFHQNKGNGRVNISNEINAATTITVK
jgi:hypothetical protein